MSGGPTSAKLLPDMDRMNCKRYTGHAVTHSLEIHAVHSLYMQSLLTAALADAANARNILPADVPASGIYKYVSVAAAAAAADYSAVVHGRRLQAYVYTARPTAILRPILVQRIHTGSSPCLNGCLPVFVTQSLKVYFQYNVLETTAAQ